MVASLLQMFGLLGFALSWLSNDHYRPWVNFHSEAFAFAGIGLLTASASLSKSRKSVAVPAILSVLAVVSLLPWLQFWFGISPFSGDALISSIYVCGFGVAIGLGHKYAVKNSAPVNQDGMISSIFYILWFVATISAAIGLLQWFGLQDFLTVAVLQTSIGDRAMGNLGQPNQLATLLLMGLISLAWTFEQKRIGSLCLGMGAFFLTLVLVLTQSRAGMLSALAIAVFLSLKNWNNSSSLRPIFIFTWLFGYAVALMALPFFSSALLIGDARSMDVTTDGARMIMWKQVIHGIFGAPWFGYGWNQTSTAHVASSIVVPGSLTFTYAHNIVLDLLAWNGLPLGILITAICCWWLWSRIRTVNGITAIYATAVLIPILLHSLVEFPFAYAYFLLSAGVMVGVVEAHYVRLRTICINLHWVGGIVVLAFLLGSYIVYEYFLIEEDFRVVRFENLRVGSTPSDYVTPNVWILSHMGAMLAASRQQAAPGMSADSIEKLRLAARRFPYGALAFRYAVSLGLNGFPSEASHQMAVIRGMYGEAYYHSAVSALRELQIEKYPQLVLVKTP